jgi:hypothetical protein
LQSQQNRRALWRFPHLSSFLFNLICFWMQVDCSLFVCHSEVTAIFF